MPKPWFRRIMPLLYWPINREGVLWVIGVHVVAWPFAIASMKLNDTNPVLGWTCGVLFVAAGIAGWAVVVWKTEEDYGSS
jgi:hypothetical protein